VVAFSTPDGDRSQGIEQTTQTGLPELGARDEADGPIRGEHEQRRVDRRVMVRSENTAAGPRDVARAFDLHAVEALAEPGDDGAYSPVETA